MWERYIDPETRCLSPCRWAPLPPVWTDKLRSVTRTRSPPSGRSPQAWGSGGCCSGDSGPIWAIPHWTEDLNFWFYIFSQVTVCQFQLHKRLCPLASPLQEQLRAVIPAQDSLRTTAVPYNQLSCRPRRYCLCFLVPSLKEERGYCRVSTDAAQLHVKLHFYARTGLSLLHWSATSSSSLILPPAYQTSDISTWLNTAVSNRPDSRWQCWGDFVRCGFWQM